MNNMNDIIKQLNRLYDDSPSYIYSEIPWDKANNFLIGQLVSCELLQAEGVVFGYMWCRSSIPGIGFWQYKIQISDRNCMWIPEDCLEAI